MTEATKTAPPTATGSEDATQSMGVGFLVITGAKVWFLVSASVLNFVLPLLFTSPADYGAFGVVVNVVSLLNMVVIASTLQSVAKVVSETPHHTPRIIKRALLLQLLVVIPISLIYFALAHPIANFFGAPNYAPHLQISSLIIACYGVYAVFVGAFNGLKLFVHQASLDIIFATLRVVFILAAVALGMGVTGAIGGFAAAAVCIMLLSAVALGRTFRAPVDTTSSSSSPNTTDFDMKRLVRFLFTIMVYTFLLNILIRLDLFLIKRLSAQALLGASEPLASHGSDNLAGAYTLIQNVARIPYQAVIAITFVIFPMLSSSAFEQDHERTRAYIRDTLRYTLLMSLGPSAILACVGPDLVHAIFPLYGHSAAALPLLCFAYTLFSLLFVATTMLIAVGRPVTASLLLLGSTGALYALLHILVANEPPGPEMLSAAALAIAIAMILGCVATAITMLKQYQAFIAWPSLLRIGLIGIALYALAWFTRFELFFELPQLAWFTPPEEMKDALDASSPAIAHKATWILGAMAKAGAMFVIYGAALFLSGEITSEDRARFGRILKRKKKVPNAE